MKHHDSMKQAEIKLAKTLKQLAQWQLAATPINYAISYEYISEKNTPLRTKIDQHLFSHKSLDNFIIEELYEQFVLGKSEFRDEIFDDVEKVTADVKDTCLKSTKSSRKFLEQVDNSIANIVSSDPVQQQAIKQLKAAALHFKQQQQALVSELQASQNQASLLTQEFQAARNEIYLDPITRLYNKKALNKHFDAWIEAQPEKQIAAVVVNVDHFKEFSEKFGSLIGEVILSKIANKVSNYVGESGLPVRTGNEEFLILMPDVEASIAGEVAEKIRQGVEKIRFISSKSGVRLPQLTISLGVSEFQQRESLNSLVSRTRRALFHAQTSGRNQVAVA
ncbi:GGDEF domain-containing protein [Colwellia sp. MEBiC06753]